MEFQPLRSFSITRRLALTLASVMLLWGTHARATDIVAHSSVAATSMPRSAAVAAFSMRMIRWPSGLPVRVFVMREESPEHQSLCKQLLDIYPYQLREAWNRLVYTGTGQAPIVVNTEEEMIEKVSSTPGAIGYVSRSLKTENNIHVLGIR